MISPNEQEPTRSEGRRDLTTVLLVVTLLLALSGLGFSYIGPVVAETHRPGVRASSSFVSVAFDPSQVPSLSMSVREQFVNAPSQSQLDEVRQQYFESHIPYGRLIYTEALRNGLDPELVAAVVRVESAFQPERVSIRDAIGLMQLIPSTGELMGAGELTDPVENVRAGSKYLKYLLAQFDGDVILALAAYNSGEGTVLRYDGVPPYRETQNYVRKVSRYRGIYQQTIERLAQDRLATTRTQ